MILRLQLREFAAHKTENDLLMSGHETERFECSGAFGLIFEKKQIDVQFIKQFLRDRIIAAFRIPLALVVSTAEMYSESPPAALYTFETVVVDAYRFIERGFRINAHLVLNVASPLGIDIVAVSRRIDLNIPN